MASLSHLNPGILWKHFEAICEIPHPSKHEEEILCYLEKCCRELKLDFSRDSVGNLIVRKPATPGHESQKGVVLQSHVDMVPQKNSDKTHNFATDPIETYFDGEWLTANGTTLGADNGMGVAATMAVLESTDIVHGPLEALFTIDEETGMTGALGLEPTALQGDILLNLDSEDEGQIFIGCAGGIDVTAKHTYPEQAVPGSLIGLKISVTGFKGGHSGVDIHLGRGNANIALHSLLNTLSTQTPIFVATLKEGSLRNAIPREAFATIAVDRANTATIHEVKDTLINQLKAQYGDIEPSIAIEIAEVDCPTSCAPTELIDQLNKQVLLCPNGVNKMHPDFPGVVETSSNLAIINLQNGEFDLAILIRSSKDSSKHDLADQIVSIFKDINLTVLKEDDYPGWNPNPNSHSLSIIQKVHQDLFSEPGKIKVIHAGLECGILGAIYPRWDMISIGPTIRYPHSPDERVHVPSVNKFWQLLTHSLKSL